MSKRFKAFILIISVISVGTWAFRSLKPGNNAGFVEKEISIKQATIPGGKNKIYEDLAGFNFEYPESLKVQEIEIDDKTIYSSLELIAFNGEKLTLKIADTKFKNLESWQENFENSNVAFKVNDIYWTDIAGKQLQYGAPKKLLTTVVEANVLYQIESPMDNDGFWDQAHQLILNSFEFDESVIIQEKSAQGGENAENEDIVLIEETKE